MVLLETDTVLVYDNDTIIYLERKQTLYSKMSDGG